MHYLIISIAAFLTSLLTFFSGFGLGTLLMPVFAIFFSVETAVALTAIVHLLNNLFKAVLVGRHADKTLVLQFGVPALIAAFFGAKMLVWFTNLPSLAHYELFSRTLEITPVKLLIAILMVGFGLMEIFPASETALQSKSKNRPYFLCLGGILSGFFGGLSGHQGAFRSAFLTKSGLSKESFIGSGVMIAILVDLTRLAIYAGHFHKAEIGNNIGLLVAAILAAFAGAFLGSRTLHKVTFPVIQKIVAVLLFVIAAGLASGLI